MDKIILFARPRSGVSWLRYICRQMKNLVPVESHHEDVTFHQWDDGVQYHDLPLVTKTHWLPINLENQGKLITIIRDYKECIVRHHCYRRYDDDRTMEDYDDLQEDLIGGYSRECWSYVGYLEIFDRWVADQDKLLIYYEDLMNNPNDTIGRIGKFIGCSSHDFIQNYKLHQQASRQLYTDSQVSGEDVNFHKQQLSPMQRTKWDNVLRNHNSYLFDKYLGRYAE